MQTYRIERDHSLNTLVINVNYLLASGWQLQGGICESRSDYASASFFSQALTKEINDDLSGS